MQVITHCPKPVDGTATGCFISQPPWCHTLKLTAERRKERSFHREFIGETRCMSYRRICISRRLVITLSYLHSQSRLSNYAKNHGGTGSSSHPTISCAAEFMSGALPLCKTVHAFGGGRRHMLCAGLPSLGRALINVRGDSGLHNPNELSKFGLHFCQLLRAVDLVQESVVNGSRWVSGLTRHVYRAMLRFADAQEGRIWPIVI